MFDGSLEIGVDTLVDDIPPISGRGIPVRTVVPAQPPLKALLAHFGIEPIPDDVVTAHKREQVKAAGGSDILFSLAWLTNKTIGLTACALLVFSPIAFFVGVIGSIFEETWGILAQMGFLGGLAFLILFVAAFMLDDVFIKPRARWREVPYEYFYPYRVPEVVRGQLLLLRLNSHLLDDGLVVTILELRQAEVRLDPIAIVSAGDERYAIAIWD